MAAKQVYYEDIEIGDEIPSLIKAPLSLTTIVKFAGASGDFAPLHHDVDFAKSIGLPHAIAHGPMKLEYMSQIMTNFAGDLGRLKRLEVQFRGMDFPGDVVVGKGAVSNKFIDGEDHCVECEIYMENQRQKSTTGKAVVVLPCRVKGGKKERATRG